MRKTKTINEMKNFSSKRNLRERNQSLDDRVRNSELFPRIRDAEEQMRKDEMAFVMRLEKKKTKRQQNRSKLPAISSSPKHEKDVYSYFSSHVLNCDPSCSKYMPFDVVHYPKLYNPASTKYMPESIDHVWMLGFQHLAVESSKPNER